MDTFNFDAPLLTFHKAGSESIGWSSRNAVEGTLILGGIGSGKTTGSGRTIALKYLAAGFGGLVLTVKPEEKNDWIKYCELTGRKDDLIIVEPGAEFAFNFIDYETSQGSKSSTENIVDVLKTVIKASQEKASGKSDDAFWENALDMLLYNVVDLCRLAYGKVSVKDMYEIVESLGRKSHDGDEEGKTITSTKNSAFIRALLSAHERTEQAVDTWLAKTDKISFSEQLNNPQKIHEALTNEVPDYRLFKLVDQFFNEYYLMLAEKTRSIIDFSFIGFLYKLMREPVYSLFCSKPSNFSPDDCANGKIIILNLPVKLYQKTGRDVQILFKYIWQRAVEKRPVDEFTKPVFLWADEAQNFIHEHDAVYQATARSSRIATVYITQNLPNYLASMGGDKYEQKVRSFLGTLATKIFHANSEVETNVYASNLIGETRGIDTSSTSGFSKEFSMSQTQSRKIEKLVLPADFTHLLTGGPTNNYKVQAYVHLQGMGSNQDNHFPITFNQNSHSLK